ncbi:branched-chain amino acid ABC transporter permease [Noviherbaspirillum cavernae]|uniref:Branched-chain amino acid ABC transporter permease n=1 Tax=Noviherbaspirillum cavernae TaxID=2320862 RepID=A0A418WYC6_9BURK|nr:AzlC family ABC transporter permease [Noviherbaspirillum cavernae]RJG05217.1 branched-chain amino acid ABC transporter permease [Noviherbaspirillum cavernae]
MNNTQATTSGAGLRDVEKQAYREAFKLAWPTMPGVAAWGMVTGMAMVKSGMTIWQALGMTFTVFAGSAQLASIPLIAANVPIWVVFVTAMVVNLRFVIFSAALAPHFAHLPWYRRVWYGYFNADIMMGLFPRRFPASTIHQTEGKIGFFGGIGYSNWIAWQIGAVAGILLASQIPQSWGIGFAGTLALLGVMIPLIINSAALVGVVVASIVAIAAIGLPYRLGLLLAVILGMAAAMMVETAMEKKKDKT